MHVLILAGMLAIFGGAAFDNNNETLDGWYDDACEYVDGVREDNGDCTVEYDFDFGWSR